MRLVYVDEAGTAPAEPVRVVAGLIVEVDEQLRKTEFELNKIYADFVPRNLRPKFQFHATDIFSGKLSRGNHDWPLLDRLDLIKAVLSLPRALNLPICFATVFSNSTPIHLTPKGMRRHEYEHCEAFAHCLSRANHYLRRMGGKELGAAVVEDIPQLRKHLDKTFDLYKDFMGNFIFPPGRRDMTMPPNHRTSYYNPSLDLIINSPLYLKKGKSLILDISDALAFAIRRWVSGYDHAHDLVHAMFGSYYADLVLGDPIWTSGPNSFSLVDHAEIEANERKSKS